MGWNMYIGDRQVQSVYLGAHEASDGFILGSGLNYWYGYPSSGRIFRKPDDFVPPLPCTFTMDINRVVQHNMDFTQYTGGTALYVNLDTGNDTSGDGSSDAPYKTIKKAMLVARDGAYAAYCVKVKSDTIFNRDQGWDANGLTFTNKIIALIPDNVSGRIKISSADTTLSWTEDGTGTWKATRSSVYSVYDIRQVDTNGLEIPLVNQTSLANCRENANTWYTDNTYVWVHTPDGLIPDSNILVCLFKLSITLLGTSKMYFKDVTILGSGTGNGFQVNGDSTGATVVGEFCADGCNFIGSNLRYATKQSGNSFTSENLKYTYMFNCKAAYGWRDAFNFHYAKVPDANRRDCLAIGYGNEGYSTGGLDESNQGSTCHDGANVLRINGNYHNSNGSVVADVNGCYSILIDCNAKNSYSANPIAYVFDNTAPPVGLTGKVIMIHCTNTGETEGSSQISVGAGVEATLYSSPLINVGAGTPTYIPPI